jgi:hypothetical protein
MSSAELKIGQARVLAHLQAKHAVTGETIEIEYWPDWQKYGVRVAEVSFVGTNSAGFPCGAAYMQSDPDGLLVCAAVERAVLDAEDEDEFQRALDLLDFVLSREA